MAQESIEKYLKQIFGNRRYCSHCGAMTPVLGPQDIDVSASGISMQLSPTCECCGEAYDQLFPALKIQETYGIAIFNESQSIKVVKSMK